jgi:hypothetical protein
VRFDGSVLTEADMSLTVDPMSIASVALPSVFSQPGDPSSEVLVADCGGQRSWWWFAPDHQLALRPRS